MPINQPIIGDNQADNSWKLEATNQINNEEVRVNALTSQVDGIQTTATEFIMNISLGFLAGASTGSSSFPVPFNGQLIGWAVWIGARPNISVRFEVLRNNVPDTSLALTATSSIAANSVLRSTGLSVPVAQFSTVGLFANHSGLNTSQLRAAGTLIFRRT